MDNRTQIILNKLKSKACLKQQIYSTTIEVFSELKAIAQEISEKLASNISEIDNVPESTFMDMYTRSWTPYKLHGRNSSSQILQKIFLCILQQFITNKYFGNYKVENFSFSTFCYIF